MLYTLNVYNIYFSKVNLGTSLIVQWLRILASTEGVGSISGWGTKIPHNGTAKKKRKRFSSMDIEEGKLMFELLLN